MRRTSPRIAAAVLAGGVSLACWSAPASQWQVVHDESTLAFTATQTGSEFDGSFDFAADMRFDRANLAASAFDVTVDITSVDTGSRRRDQALAEQAWFWFEQHPEAHFRTQGIAHVTGERYEAVADLTIKGNTHEVTLPFTWRQDGDTAELQGSVKARMQGGLTMDRTRWDVGTGEWSSGDTIGREVEVRVDLLLTR